MRVDSNYGSGGDRGSGGSGNFRSLSEQFENLTHQLKGSNDPTARKQILAQLRDVIGKIDGAISINDLDLPWT